MARGPGPAGHFQLLAGHINQLTIHKFPEARTSAERAQFFLRRCPVRNIELLGVVVSVLWKENFVRFGIDDGTGVIECVAWIGDDPTVRRNLPVRQNVPLTKQETQALSVDLDRKALAREAYDNLELGRLVMVLGRLKLWLAIELHVQLIRPETDPNAEVLHWLKAIHSWKLCYQDLLQHGDAVQPPVQSHQPDEPEGSKTSGELPVLELVQGQLADPDGCFSLKQCYELPALRALAAGADQQSQNKELTEDQTLQCVKKAIVNLRNAGQVFQVSPVSDVFSTRVIDSLLKPAVLSLLRRTSNAAAGRASSSSSGSSHCLSAASIASMLPRDEPRSRHVRPAQVKQALHMLVQDGTIYEVGHDRYAITSHG